MRLYRALLHLYPAGFRAEYADDLCALFALRRAQASNPFAVLALWLDAIADTCSSAIAAHWDILRRDLAWSARSLRRSPAFALTAIAVSALGIGATTAAFTLADHVLLRPLPYADSARLVKIWEDDSAARLSPHRSLSRQLPRLEAPLPLLRRRRSLVGSRRQSLPGRQSRAARRRRNHRRPAAHARHTTRAWTRLHPG